MQLPVDALRVRSQSQIILSTESKRLRLFVLAHIPLAFVITRNSWLATLHTAVALCYGFYWAMRGRSIEKTIYAAGYIVGCELLWRISRAHIFWEFGKYTIVLLFGILIMRYGRRPYSPPLIYLVCMMVSIPLTLDRLGPTRDARVAISFNLSGPLAMAISIIFFQQIRAQWHSVRHLLWYSLAPIVGIATMALYGFHTNPNIQFVDESMHATSAGYGPNQVANVLGMGAIFSFFLSILEANGPMRQFALTICVWLCGQCILTFSRGGMLSAVLCVIVLAMHYLPARRTGKMFFLTSTIVLAILVLVVIPRIDQLSGGMLETRWSGIIPGLKPQGQYANQTPGRLVTHRETLMESEIAIWRNNFFFGVGPGVGKFERYQRTGMFGAAHTEFSRTLAEHGLIGLIGLVALLLSVVACYRRSPSLMTKGWLASLAIWSMSSLTHSAMRMAAFSFVCGLAFIQWQEQGLQKQQR